MSKYWELPRLRIAAGSDGNASLIRDFTTGEMEFCLATHNAGFRQLRKRHPDFPKRTRVDEVAILWSVPEVRAWIVAHDFETAVFDLRVTQILSRQVGG